MSLWLLIVFWSGHGAATVSLPSYELCEKVGRELKAEHLRQLEFYCVNVQTGELIDY